MAIMIMETKGIDMIYPADRDPITDQNDDNVVYCHIARMGLMAHHAPEHKVGPLLGLVKLSGMLGIPRLHGFSIEARPYRNLGEKPGEGSSRLGPFGAQCHRQAHAESAAILNAEA